MPYNDARQEVLMHQDSAPALFAFRAFDPAHDFSTLVALMNAIDAADQGGEPTSEEEQRAQLTWPGRDLPRDRWLATPAGHPDHLLGYGDSWKMPSTGRADIYVGIHPAWQRRGLGTQLMRRTLARASEQGAASVAVYADAAHPFLRAQGFQVAGASRDLWMPIPHPYSQVPSDV
jgi:GNAT superfamily N-acetyltransferase